MVPGKIARSSGRHATHTLNFNHTFLMLPYSSFKILLSLKTRGSSRARLRTEFLQAPSISQLGEDPEWGYGRRRVFAA